MMTAKKIGKAVWDPATEMWKVGMGSERFMINRRLVDTNPEVKSIRHVYSRASSKNTPSKRKLLKREEYLQGVKSLRKEYEAAIKKAFEDIRLQSFEGPVPLRLDKDYDHKGDWRYCLYEGFVYLFNRAGYSEDEMAQQIKNLEIPKEKGETSESK